MKEKVEYFIDNISELRIYDAISELTYEPIVEHYDFTTCGLRTETPKYGIKGIKQSADYTINGECVVKKTFNYQEDGLWLTLEWMKSEKGAEGNDVVGIRKVIFKPLNIIEIYKINKANRDRTITWLQAEAVGTPIENFVNALLKHYKTEVDLFIYNDTDDFKNAVENEPSTIKDANGNDILDADGNPQPNPYYQYLRIVIEAPSTDYPKGKRVMDSILEQIT